MPNWVKNRLIIQGENAEEIIKQYLTKDEEGHIRFDFNTIEKMPEELMIEKGSRSIDGLKLYLAKINPTIPNVGEKTDKVEYLSYAQKLLELFGQRAMDDITKYMLRPSEVEDLKRKYRKDFDEVVELGRKVFCNKQKYGVSDWYDWSCEHWGTKWNACATEIDGNVIYFETAYAPAIPAIEKFAKMHPELEIEHSFAEEQAGILSGSYVFRNGKVITGAIYNDESVDAYEMHFVLWDDKDDFEYDEKSKTYFWKEESEME